MAQAIALAKQLKDTHATALALWHAGVLRQFERNPAEVESLTSEIRSSCGTVEPIKLLSARFAEFLHRILDV